MSSISRREPLATCRLEPLEEPGAVLVVFDDTVRIAATQPRLDRPQGKLEPVLATEPDSGEIVTHRPQLDDTAADLHALLEELATSKEELQATNAELLTLDEENRQRLLELTEISADLQHLPASTGIATLFLDRELKVMHFTPLIGELFGLRLTDPGRPLLDLGYHSAQACRAGASGASRRKDEFLTILAHELRNPLAPISAGVEILKTAHNKPRIVEQIAATMRRQTRQPVRLVDDLLEISRIGGGKLHLRTASFDLNEAVQDALFSTQPAMEDSGHKLTVNLPREPLWLEGDAARLTQVVSNLLSNAVRYTPPRGSIAVMAARQDDTSPLTWLRYRRYSTSGRPTLEALPPDPLAEPAVVDMMSDRHLHVAVSIGYASCWSLAKVT